MCYNGMVMNNKMTLWTSHLPNDVVFYELVKYKRWFGLLKVEVFEGVETWKERERQRGEKWEK
jgi:hypothetical protein